MGWTRTLSPSKSGGIYGTFTPSPIKTIKVQKNGGQIVDVPLTRKQRRIVARRMAKHG